MQRGRRKMLHSASRKGLHHRALLPRLEERRGLKTAATKSLGAATPRVRPREYATYGILHFTGKQGRAPRHMFEHKLLVSGAPVGIPTQTWEPSLTDRRRNKRAETNETSTADFQT